MNNDVAAALFQAFPKIPRLYKEILVTEKIDGTNAHVWITEWEDVPFYHTYAVQVGMYAIFAGSRNRFLTTGADNFGFHAWVRANAEVLLHVLGQGRHYGEWWGAGIQRTYGLDHKRFSLFNVDRWSWLANPEARAKNEFLDGGSIQLHVVPTLYQGEFGSFYIDRAMHTLTAWGSSASNNGHPAEGIMVYHTAAKHYFKVPFDTEHKGNA